MGTRSDIIVQMTDGSWARIYCHWDGYLSHNGRILFDHYTSQTMVEALVSLGDLSKLGPEIGKKHPFERPYKSGDDTAAKKYDRLYGNMCVAYTRDRDEKGCAASTGATLQEVWPEKDTWTEFTYVWTEGQWFVADPDTGSQALVNLGDALSGKTAVTAGVKVFGAVVGEHMPHDPKQPRHHTWARK